MCKLTLITLNTHKNEENLENIVVTGFIYHS